MHGIVQVLDDNQKIALDLFRAGRSIALIGGGGTGKSFLLKKMIEIAEQNVGCFPSVAPCALSNRAAEDLKGVTIHKLFGAKPSWEFSKQYLLEGLKSKPHLCNLLKKIKVFIIDEISLLTSNMIDAIDFVLRHFSADDWHASLPLGGRQIILSGDPYQLEPYADRFCVQRDALRTAYQSRTWYLNFGPPGDGVVFNLQSNHRQCDDPALFSVLNRIRVGAHTNGDIEKLNCHRGSATDPPDGYTRLCLTNDQAARINKRKIAEISGSLITMRSTDTFIKGDRSNLERKLDSVAPRVIHLKKGSQVITTRKLQHHKGIIPPGVHGTVHNLDLFGSESARTKAIVTIELSRDFTFERSSQEHTVSPCGQIRAHRTVVRVEPVSFEVHRFDRSVVAMREQFPLIPAYAITIHRSQGLTLRRVAIDFQVAQNWKPHGMAYVALSRCVSTRGLWVRGLKSSHVSISSRARDVMKELWELYMHVPSRIWGVRKPSCLNLSKEDISSISKNTSGTDGIRDTSRIHPDRHDTKRPVSASKDVLDSSVRNDCRCTEKRAQIILEPRHLSGTLPNVLGKRDFSSIQIVDDHDSDIEVLFMGVVKRRRKDEPRSLRIDSHQTG